MISPSSLLTCAQEHTVGSINFNALPFPTPRTCIVDDGMAGWRLKIGRLRVQIRIGAIPEPISVKSVIGGLCAP